jgi:protein SCO1/2
MATMADKARLRRLRRSIQILGALAVVLVGATAWLVFRPGGPLVQTAPDVVQIGAPFELVSHTGDTFSDRDLAGTPFTVFFGFTHCPEVCPTTLWEMSAALEQLGDEAKNLRVLFVTVDPERDTPEALATYLQSFSDRIVGLTGSPDEIAAIATAYRAYWRKVPTDDGDYTMDHTASIYLMDANGQFFGTLAYEEQEDARLSKLRRLIATGAS